ncbi:hypothetical protein LTR85_006289 [Meristemomyces frigidus]|nr:hypothetical protein LTR85_006289 [Meristemomyces frigidus]
MDPSLLDPALDQLQPRDDGDGDYQPEEAEDAVSDADEDEYDDTQLQQARTTHNQQLKSRFESIFAKYERDFTGVGDEIDLETGEIVVDNGHLANMRQELDSGKGASLQFFTDFAEDLEHGDEDGSSGGSGSSDESVDSADESDADMEDEESTSGDDAEDMQLDPFLQQLSDAAAGNAATNPLLPIPSLDGAGDTRSVSTEEGRREGSRASEESETASTAPTNVMDMPAVKETLLALKSKSRTGRTVDPDAIQALGVSIASQIAQFIGTGGRSKSRSRREKKRKDPVWDFPELPADKRRRIIADAPPQQPSLPILSAAISPRRRRGEPRESLWAPIRHPKPRKRKRAAGPERAPEAQPRPARVAPSAAFDGEDAAEQLQDELQNDFEDVAVLRKCYNCAICATTTWRRGPEGDLCNACGMYLYRYGLMKPPRPTTPEVESEPEEDARDDSYYSANTSRRIASKPRRFTVEEDALIIKLKEFDRRSWEKIGRHFDGRSSFAVQCRYAKKLIGQPSEGRNALIEQGFSFDKGKGETGDGEFTEQNDELLVQLREESELDWASIAKRVSGQTAESVEARYNLLLGIYPEGAELDLQHPPKRMKPVDPDLPARSSRVFEPFEDELIVKLREVNKLPWTAVASQIADRSGLAVQKRYVRELDRRKAVVAKGGADPYAHVFVAGEASDFENGDADEERIRLEEKFVAHSSLTLAEETLLMRLKDEEGLSWEYIVDRMPGRSALILRNRYETIQAKKEKERQRAAALESASVYDIPVSDGYVPDGNAQLSSTSPPKRVRKYNPEEDQLILKLRGEGMGWERMSWHLPGRSAGSLEGRWQSQLKRGKQFQPEESEVDAGSAMADGPESVMQDDNLAAIDPSLDREGPTSRDTRPSFPEQNQRRSPQSTNPRETGSTAGASAPSYVPTEDGSEISHDPYQHFAVRKQQVDGASTETMRHTAAILQPAKPGSKYSQQEHDIVAKLRAEGLEWPQIAARLPGRSAKSVYGHWTTHIGRKKSERDSLPASLGAGLHGENSTLLRQALNNGARRQSDFAPPYGGVPSRGALYGTPMGAPSSVLLPGAMMLGGTMPPMNLFHSLLQRSPGRAVGALASPTGSRLPPEDSSQHEQRKKATLLPSALPSALDDTSANVPEVLAARRASVVADSDNSRAETPESFVSAAESQSAVQIDEGRVDGEDSFEDVPSLPQTPMRSVGTQQHTTEPTPTSATPFQPTPAPVTSYYTPARYSQQAMPYFVAPTASMYSPLAAEAYAQHTPARRTAEPGFEDEVLSPQQRAAASRARARRSWTPVIDPPVPSDDETVDVSDAESDNIPEHLRSPPGATLGPDKPPPFSWNELITMALKSSREQRLSIRDIYSYLEQKFPYFKICGNSWRTTLRQRLSMSDDFDGRGSGLAAIWSFADKRPVYVGPKRRPVRPRKRASSEVVHAEDTDPQVVQSSPLYQPVAEEPLIERPATQEPEAELQAANTPSEGPSETHSPAVEIAASRVNTPAQDEGIGAPAPAHQALPAEVPAHDESTRAPTTTMASPDDDCIEVAMPLGESASPQVTAPAASGDIEAPAKAKRGPGRPRKGDVMIKNVARPLTSTPAASETSETPVKVKRGPGRPRKGEVVVSARDSGLKKGRKQYTLFTDAERQQLAPLVLRGASTVEMEAALDGRSLLDIESHLKTERWSNFITAYRTDGHSETRLRRAPSEDDGGAEEEREADDEQDQASAPDILDASHVDHTVAASAFRSVPSKIAPQPWLHAHPIPSSTEATGQAASSSSSSNLRFARHGDAPRLQASVAENAQQPMTSDIFRDPESTPATIRARQKMEEFRKYLAEHSDDSESDSDDSDETSGEGNQPTRLAKLQADFQMRQPSSPGHFPAFAETKRPAAASMYGRNATPKTPGPLAAQLGRASTNGPVSGSLLPGGSRFRSNSRAGSVRRTSQTPMHPVDGSEDELA